jgi:small-conductance mechanosensitive channel/uncharacterized membrane protein
MEEQGMGRGIGLGDSGGGLASKGHFRKKVVMGGIFLAATILFWNLWPQGNLLGQPPQEEKRDLFPSVAEVVPRAEEVTRRSLEVRAQLELRAQLQEFEKRIREAEVRLQELARRLRDLGDPNRLDFQRVLDARSPLETERKSLENYLVLISGKLGELESLKKEWEELGSFWARWRKSASLAQGDLPTEAFTKAEQSIRETLQDLSQRMGILVGMQEQVGKLLEENRRLSAPLDAALARMREETFRRTEPSILSQRFFLGLRDLVAGQGPKELLQMWRKLQDPMAGNEAMLFSQLLALVLLWGLFLWIERARGKEAHRVTLHPLALAILGVGIFSSLVGDVGGILKAVGRCLFALSVTILWTEERGRARWRGPLFGLAVSMGVLDCLRTIGFPAPLCRLFILGISSVGLALLLGRSKKSKLEALVFYLWACILALVLIAEMAGFANLADRLFRASAWSTFLVLTGWILVSLVGKGIDWAMEHPRLREWKILVEVGPFLRRRLFFILAAAIWLSISLRILPVWGLFSSSSEAWERLFKSDISIGKVSLNLELLILALLAVYISLSLSRIINKVLEAEVFPKTEVDPGARHAMGRLLHYFLVVVGLLMALSLLGVRLESFLVLGGALGVGIGFGLQHVANNFISGLILLFERPIKVGDTVVVEKEWGRVKRIGLRSTVIETFDRSELIVPNAQLVSSTVINWTLSNPMARIRIRIGVAYGTDLAKALSLLVEAAKANPKVLEDPSPNALITGFGDSSMDLELHAWVGDIKERLLAQSEICKEIERLFRENGIEIPYPQRDIHLRSWSEPPCLLIQRKDEGKKGEG